MNYKVNYVCQCNTGKVRKENQDNFWCMGNYLDSRNSGLLAPVTGSAEICDTPVFAVFDGIGGEQYGEIAAFIAAESLEKVYNDEHKNKSAKQFLDFSCEIMNNNICKYAENNNIYSMGTTAAVLMFEKTSACVCNLGDSKIYQYSDSSLIQRSQDHVSPSLFGGRKPALAQYLGIPEEEFVINPYIEEYQCRPGDRFVICSDGLTDMLSENEIKCILSDYKDLPLCAEMLLNTVLDKGGIDNVTIILCDFLENI